MHDLALNQGLKCMKDLHEVLQCFLLRQFLLAFEIGQQIPLVAVLKDQIDVVRCFFDVDQPHDVVVLATLEHLDLVLEEFCELALVRLGLPLILSRLMVLTATSVPSTLL